MSDQQVKYRLAQTVVRIVGTVTIEKALGAQDTTTRTSDVLLATEADPHDKERTIDLSSSVWHSQTASIHLAGDQRLTSAKHTATGAGAKVVEAAVRLATIAVKLAPVVAAAFLESAPEVGAPSTLDEAVLEQRRERFHDLVTSLEDSLGNRLAAIAASEGDNMAQAMLALRTTEAALSAARAELALLDAAYDAWHAARFPSVVEQIEYSLPTSALPELEDDPDEIDRGDLKLGEAETVVADRLGIIVARIADPGDEGGDPHRENGVHYRLPRRVRLAVYRAADDGPPSTKFRLHTSSMAWVIDAKSELGFVDFESAFFGKRAMTIGFGDSGTLSVLSNSSESTAGVAAPALSSAGSEIVESLGQAGKIAKAFPSEPDPATETLEKQVKQKELEARLAKANHVIATGGAGGRDDSNGPAAAE
jgi:hypothetical protein